MQVSVWDTYVKRSDGITMHFDILVPSHMTDEGKILNYGKKYLREKPFDTGPLTTKECLFCHVEEAIPAVVDEITKNGFYIVEMQNCS